MTGVEWSAAMDGQVHRSFRGGGPSTFDLVMLAVSFFTIAWIVFAH